MKRLVCYLALAMFMLLPIGTAGAKLSSTFVDTQGHWAQGEIETACNRGLMQGTGTDESGLKLFSPQAKVDRCQLAAVIRQAFDLDYGNMRFVKEPVCSDYYYDVPDKQWYSQAVLLGAINHIFAPADEFQGEKPVTRIEAARTIYNAFQVKGINVPMIMVMPAYDDTAQLSREDTNAMIFVSNTGIMKGNDYLFRPHDTITRAELARVLNQCVKLIEINPVEPSPAAGVKLEIKEVKSESPLINIDLNIPVVTGLSGGKIPDQLNRILAGDAQERENAMVKQAQEDSDFIMTEPYHTYEIVSRFNQYFTTPDILSFYVDYYTYTGGAHGMTDRVAYNFDLNTGRELALSDLFAPGTDYCAIINERVRSLIRLDPEPYFEGDSGFKGIKADQRFYLENGSLMVYFLQYEIAPYAAGIRTFPIPLPACPLMQGNDEAAIRQLVADFGSRLKNVSLLAPAAVLKENLKESYAGRVAPELLAKWQDDPDNAPGRVTSSPWPEAIAINTVEKTADLCYEIKGDIISMTSMEMVSGKIAGKRAVTLQAEKLNGHWLITSLHYDEKAASGGPATQGNIYISDLRYSPRELTVTGSARIWEAKPSDQESSKHGLSGYEDNIEEKYKSK